MTANPTTQNFAVALVSDMPASVLGNNDVIDFLNSAPQSLWNDAVAGALGVDALLGQGITGVSSLAVAGSRWVNSGGKAALDFTLTTVSDPVEANQLAAALEVIGGIILIAASQAFDLVPVAGWAVGIIGAILAFAGVLSLLSVSVTQLGGAITGNPVTTFAVVGVVALALVAGSLVLYSIAKNPQARQQLGERVVSYGR